MEPRTQNTEPAPEPENSEPGISGSPEGYRPRALLNPLESMALLAGMELSRNAGEALQVINDEWRAAEKLHREKSEAARVVADRLGAGVMAAWSMIQARHNLDPSRPKEEYAVQLLDDGYARVVVSIGGEAG